MTFTLTVTLLSGQMVTLEVDGSTRIAELRQMAQLKLGRTLVALVTHAGTRLDVVPTLFSTLCSLGLQEGSVVTAVSKAGPILQSHRKASTFAAIRADGTVITWGHKFHGGDSRAVRDQLVNVLKVYATNKALAAVKTDGTVVTWGHADQGGDSAAVQDQLVHVREIFPSMQAFAALRYDGSIVTWGLPSHGGSCKSVAKQLVNVQEVHATEAAFAAILEDRSVVTWGHPEQGGDSTAVRHELHDVRSIAASGKAFAAVRGDGHVLSWGHCEYGGDCSAVKEELQNVRSVHSSSGAFAAIMMDGTVQTWGHALSGGDCRGVQSQLVDVEQIYVSNKAFAAVTRSGDVVTWGHPLYGGDSRSAQMQLVRVQQVHAAETAFAAIRDDGSVVTWGHPEYGGVSAAVQDRLRDLTGSGTLGRNVQQIYASLGAFAAIRADGAVATWGHPAYGGDSSIVRDQLFDILEVHASSGAFAAVRADGVVITWGHPLSGGDSRFGEVVETDVKRDPHTGRSKGFGFVTFASEEPAEACLAEPKGHSIDGKTVELKRYGYSYPPGRTAEAEPASRRPLPTQRDSRAPPGGTYGDHGGGNIYANYARPSGQPGQPGLSRPVGGSVARDYDHRGYDHRGYEREMQPVPHSKVAEDVRWFGSLAEMVPAHYLDQDYCITCSLPHAQCGALIGRGGENINEVERKTGTNVQLSKKEQDSDHRTLTIIGPLISVYAAHLLMMRHFNDALNAGPPAALPGPPDGGKGSRAPYSAGYRR
eukprot:s568_g2.t1